MSEATEKIKAMYMAKQNTPTVASGASTPATTTVDLNLNPEDQVLQEVQKENTAPPNPNPTNLFTQATPEQLKKIQDIDAIPSDIRVMSDEEVFMDASIEARPLYMPEMLTVKSKDPHYILRWVNCKAQGGMNLNKMQFAGFTVAQKEDIEGLDPNISWKDGAYRHMDVILMKIQRLRYQQHLKANYIKSARSVGKNVPGAREQASSQLAQHGGIATAINQGKVSLFTPGEAEANAMVSGNGGW